MAIDIIRSAAQRTDVNEVLVARIENYIDTKLLDSSWMKSWVRGRSDEKYFRFECRGLTTSGDHERIMKLYEKAGWDRVTVECKPQAVEGLPDTFEPVTVVTIYIPTVCSDSFDPVALAEGNDVQLNHNYALHVLTSLTHAMKKLPVKKDDFVGKGYSFSKWVEEHKKLLESVDKLHQQLHGIGT